MGRTYLCVDQTSYFSSCECVERGLDPITTKLVVADRSRTEATICLAVSPAMKKLGVKNRCRLYEIPPKLKYITAMPQMALYLDYSARIYGVFLRYLAPEDIRRTILDADMMVFVTPLYYYGMSAQLKTLIDRFCAFNSSIQRKRMKSALLTVAWNSDNWTFDALEAHYKTLVQYLNLKDQGMVLGRGCGTPSMTKHSGYPEKAYALGRDL